MEIFIGKSPRYQWSMRPMTPCDVTHDTGGCSNGGRPSHGASSLVGKPPIWVIIIIIIPSKLGNINQNLNHRCHSMFIIVYQSRFPEIGAGTLFLIQFNVMFHMFFHFKPSINGGSPIYLVGGWATPLKNIQLGLLFQIYGKIKVMFQTTNQICNPFGCLNLLITIPGRKLAEPVLRPYAALRPV